MTKNVETGKIILPPINNLKMLFLIFSMLLCTGCATAPQVAFPAATRVLGVATIYHSASGERLEVMHDTLAGIAIVKLPDGTVTILPAEFVGSEEHYKDARMTIWEHDNGAQLWIDGNVAFSGTIEK